ncbi:GNAT family N-acetyltransferase [Pedobacter frigidisoli]|uniref:GNAT family N-acetyltransferase n=1 Tax=Pedobacter frigidisoli TaxID=2530455 RepID=UPI0021D08552|nr:GNAT family N-acetyltransferase [Pedobacter frigidisoli]
MKLITEKTNGYTNYYDIGYRFIRNSWKKGYATESAKAVIEYGFKVLNLPEIIGIADVENFSSIHVLEKIGLKKIEQFDYEQRMHHWMKIENQF